MYFRGETEAAENLHYKEGETYESCLCKGYEMLDLAFNNWQDDFVVKSVAEAFIVEVPGLQKPLIGEFDMVKHKGKSDFRKVCKEKLYCTLKDDMDEDDLATDKYRKGSVSNEKFHHVRIQNPYRLE